MVLVDFGMATHAAGPESLTGFCGSLGYMAPEIIHSANVCVGGALCGPGQCALLREDEVPGGGRLLRWLILPLCPGARPGPPPPHAMGGRDDVVRRVSHAPRTWGAARAAFLVLASGTPGPTTSRVAPCPPACLWLCFPLLPLTPPPPCFSWCDCWALVGASLRG